MNEDMNNKRRFKRSDLDVTVQMRRCDGSDHKQITVEVHDLSREGMGFYSTEDIKIGEIYNGEIVIWTKEIIKVVLKIVRRTELQDKEEISYGTEFVGLTEAEKFRIDVYQCVEENIQK